MHGMNRAKTVYYDGKGNMIKNTNYKDKSKLIMNYLEDNPIEFGDMDIQFLQRGSVYSIGFVEGVNNDKKKDEA